MDKDKLEKRIAEWGFDVWKEAKSTTEDNWDDVTWESLPQKHKEEYYKSARRLVDLIDPDEKIKGG